MPYYPCIMKNNKLIVAAIPGIIALAAIVLSFRASVSAETLVAYVSVVSILALGALDYRVSWSRVLGR